MLLSWTDLTPLWLLLAVPLVWLAYFAARTNFNPRQRWLQGGVRSLLLVTLAFALARPVISTSSSRQSIVYVVDISHSIASRALDEAAKKIDDLNGALHPAHFRIVAFGRSATVLENSSALRRLAQAEPGKTGADPVDRGGTDLEAALDVARAELAPGYVPRLVLFSDGQATAGDTSAAVARLAADRIPLSVEPLGVRSLGDTWVDAIDLPDRIAAGESFAATVQVGSQRDGTALVELRVDGKVVGSRTVPVSKGLTRVVLDAAVPAAGAHVVQSGVSMANDPLPVNNTLDRGVWADARAKVLYVEGTPSSAHYLSDALGNAGFDVTLQPPSALPLNPSGLDPWDVVILSDVARSAIPDASMSSLSEWV